ncbi:MAG: hypothetical protein ACRC1H_09550, partial [Caldilineaceae bacterium]
MPVLCSGLLLLGGTLLLARISSRRPWVRIALAASLLLGLALIGLAPAATLQAQGQARLEVHSLGPVAPGTTVDIPVVYTSGPTQVSVFLFSFDFDEACLQFDPVDANRDFRPDNIILSPAIAAAYSRSATYNAADNDGEIDVAIYAISSRPPVIPSGTLLTLRMTTICSPPAGSTHLAPIAYSQAPRPSFGSPAAVGVPVDTVSGGVLVQSNAPVLTSTPTPTATPTAVNLGMLTATPTAPPVATETATPPPGSTPTSTPEGNITPIATLDATATPVGSPEPTPSPTPAPTQSGVQSMGPLIYCPLHRVDTLDVPPLP